MICVCVMKKFDSVVSRGMLSDPVNSSSFGLHG